ncbi:hypothetical protein ABZ387_31880 [Streptomyces flaveolus]|uniref:hypothetical protein n=1 Tax=Streptomyces flaveolus TaxID=67297 RepID=UPI00340CC4E7
MHALDYVVLLQVVFNVASGAESTPLSVWEQLKERGIRSAKNARELVGKNAVYESFARLLEAGYVRRTQLPHPTEPGRKGPVVYEVFDNPAWNPDWSPASSEIEDHDSVNPQVATLPGTPDPSSGEADKTGGQNASRNTGRGNDGSGVPGSGKRRVPAGQTASRVPGSGIASPPHPPEEVETSSPSPLTGSAGSLPSQREEEAAEFSPEDIAAAERFLQTLRKPWALGLASARKCAPLLLREMQGLGWPPIHEVDHDVLERDILRNTEGAKSPAHILPKWIKDLRLYSVVTKQGRSGPGRAAGMCDRHPNFPEGDCSPCRLEERRRDQRKGSGLAPVNGAELLARLRAGSSDTAS